MEETITYFEKSGEKNTENVFRLVKERAKKRNISTIVLASTTGSTAIKAAKFLVDSNIKLVIVPHQFGFRDVNKLPTGVIKKLEAKGHIVHFGTMPFHTEKLYGIGTPQVIADFLRTFGQGMKVCIEIVLIATDGGKLIRGERVIAVAGTIRGADTAAVITPATTQQVKELKVHEIICKPYL